MIFYLIISWIVQNSKYNDIQIQKIKKKKTYNKMLKQHISNINQNITIKYIKKTDKFK